MDVRLKRALPQDVGFLLKPWLEQLRESPHTMWVDDETYFESYKTRILDLLTRYGATIAHDPMDEGHYYGFVCFGDRAVHWLYVKATYRGFGIGRQLLAHAHLRLGLAADEPIPCTHGGAVFSERSTRDKYHLHLDPTLLRTQ